MSVLPEFVGTVHIILGPYKGNPIGIYLLQEGGTCRIGPNIYPWNRIIGTGETTNKAAADFEAKWKESGLADEMYTGPHWEAGIKPEKPKPPPKPAAPRPAAPPETKPSKTEAAVSSQSSGSGRTASAPSPSALTTPIESQTPDAPAKDPPSNPSS